VENDALFLQPFVGLLWTPTDRHFVQGFLQWDFDACGYTVTTGGGSGVVQDQHMMYADVQAGYWLYQDPCAPHITGIAPVVELHYTTTLNDADAFGGLSNSHNRLDFLNITGGLQIDLSCESTITLAAAVPVSRDRLFDVEVMLQWNSWF
jgi:hypothetical protein